MDFNDYSFSQLKSRIFEVAKRCVFSKTKSLSLILRDCDEGWHPSWTTSTSNALARLKKLGICTPEQLVSRIHNLTVKDRLHGVYLLGRLGRKRDIPILLKMAHTDRSENVCLEAVQAVGRIGGKSAVRGLREILENRRFTDEIRWLACEGILDNAAEEQLDFILSLIRNQEEHWNIRSLAIELVTNLIGTDDRRRKPWRSVVITLLPLLEHRNGEIRFWSMFTLGICRAKQALPRLRQLARQDKFVSSMGWPNCEEAKDVIYVIKHDRWPEPDAYERMKKRRGEGNRLRRIKQGD